nr:uncharacterized protein LOC109177226 isoform X2 [Ipomoea trifida]
MNDRVSFGVAAILMGTATSMNKSQPLGEGWLDGECYMVKNGVFSASAILIIITVASTLASALITTQKRQLVEQATKEYCAIVLEFEECRRCVLESRNSRSVVVNSSLRAWNWERVRNDRMRR